MPNSTTQFVNAVRINYLKTGYAKHTHKKTFIHLFDKYSSLTTIRQALLDTGDISVNEMDKNACPPGDKKVNRSKSEECCEEKKIAQKGGWVQPTFMESGRPLRRVM